MVVNCASLDNNRRLANRGRVPSPWPGPSRVTEQWALVIEDCGRTACRRRWPATPAGEDRELLSCGTRRHAWGRLGRPALRTEKAAAETVRGPDGDPHGHPFRGVVTRRRKSIPVRRREVDPHSRPGRLKRTAFRRSRWTRGPPFYESRRFRPGTSMALDGHVRARRRAICGRRPEAMRGRCARWGGGGGRAPSGSSYDPDVVLGRTGYAARVPLSVLLPAMDGPAPRSGNGRGTAVAREVTLMASLPRVRGAAVVDRCRPGSAVRVAAVQCRAPREALAVTGVSELSRRGEVKQPLERHEATRPMYGVAERWMTAVRAVRVWRRHVPVSTGATSSGQRREGERLGVQKPGLRRRAKIALRDLSPRAVTAWRHAEALDPTVCRSSGRMFARSAR